MRPYVHAPLADRPRVVDVGVASLTSRASRLEWSSRRSAVRVGHLLRVRGLPRLDMDRGEALGVTRSREFERTCQPHSSTVIFAATRTDCRYGAPRSSTERCSYVLSRCVRRCWQTSDGPLGSRAGSHEAMRLPECVVEWRSADRSTDSRWRQAVIGPDRRSSSWLAAGQVSIRFARDVSLEDAHDLWL